MQSRARGGFQLPDGNRWILLVCWLPAGAGPGGWFRRVFTEALERALPPVSWHFLRSITEGAWKVSVIRSYPRAEWTVYAAPVR